MSVRPPKRALLYGGAAMLALLLVAAFNSSEVSRMRAAGVANPGHEDLACVDCHQEAPGTARQQIQANLHFLLGMRESGVDFGKVPISVQTCVDCHQRESDRHPVFRFHEPRFVDSRRQLHVDRCTGCHVEHSSRRVRHDLGFCKSCHQDLNFRGDPISPSHVSLVEDDNWDSCLGCHDFHGNHERNTPTDYKDLIAPEVVRSYFAEGDNPYGPVLVPAQEPDR